VKGDVSGVKCYRYHRGRDGEGTCSTCCQWWPKENGQPIKNVCPYWISCDQWDTPQDIPKNEKGMYCITWEEYETRYNTKIIIEEEGEEPSIPRLAILISFLTGVEQ